MIIPLLCVLLIYVLSLSQMFPTMFFFFLSFFKKKNLSFTSWMRSWCLTETHWRGHSGMLNVPRWGGVMRDGRWQMLLHLQWHLAVPFVLFLTLLCCVLLCFTISLSLVLIFFDCSPLPPLLPKNNQTKLKQPQEQTHSSLHIHSTARPWRLVNHLQLRFHLLLGFSDRPEEGILFICVSLHANVWLTQTKLNFSAFLFLSPWQCFLRKLHPESNFSTTSLVPRLLLLLSSLTITFTFSIWPVGHWNLGRFVTGDLMQFAKVWLYSNLTAYVLVNKQTWVITPALNCYAAAEFSESSAVVFLQLVSPKSWVRMLMQNAKI